jgi:hypothetical protein
LADELSDDIIAHMANLTAAQTGKNGTIFISTAMGADGPRVKDFSQPGRSEPSFSVSISDQPAVVGNSLPARVVRWMSRRVVEWVSLNGGPCSISGIIATPGRSRRSMISSRNDAGSNRMSGRRA